MFTAFLFDEDTIWETQNGGSSHYQMLILFWKLLTKTAFINCQKACFTSAVHLPEVSQFVQCDLPRCNLLLSKGAAVKVLSFNMAFHRGFFFLDFMLKTFKKLFM